MSAELQTALTPRAASEIEQSIRIKTDNLQRILLAGACDIGLDLTDLKAKTPHGEWGATLKRLGYSSSTAGNFMRLYAEYGTAQVSLFGGSNCQTFGNLSYSKALALLAVPAEEREQFAEEVHAEELSVRQLKAKIQEAQNAAEGWKQKAELAKAAEAEKDEALQQAEQHARAQESLIASLRAENRALEERPVEVQATVDATEEQLREAERRGRDAAAQETAAELAAAKREKEELAQALEAARLETGQYQGTNEQLRAQLEAARKEKTPEEPLMRCRWLFEELQATLNALAGLLPQVDEVNRAKLKRALPGALRQLAERMEG